jgi:hypothetical protein
LPLKEALAERRTVFVLLERWGTLTPDANSTPPPADSPVERLEQGNPVGTSLVLPFSVKRDLGKINE